jgi:hypothetical protein
MGTRKRQTQCRQRLEMRVIVLQDYLKTLFKKIVRVLEIFTVYSPSDSFPQLIVLYFLRGRVFTLMFFSKT